ncbi:MAG TPA: cytochrome P450 [Kofleriaceae bacterium]|nr:cytochrome P450 [Kofleriaceae bacterium]
MSIQSYVARLPQRLHIPVVDDTLTLALEGYEMIGNRCRALGTDVFETRILMQRTICMLGAEAARVFYSDHMQRHGAAPHRMQATLLGKGGVQSLDGDEHHARKQLFLMLLTPEAIARLCADFEALLVGQLARGRDRVLWFDEAQALLCRAVCAWPGVTLDDDRRIADLSAMIEGGGRVGPRHWRGRFGRARAEWWIEKQIQRVRDGKLTATGALGVFAAAKLETKTAAVELLNVIRPTVAVARYLAFCAHALHEYPHTAQLLEADTMLEPFVHEVRRFYPFFPAAVARVHDSFEWRGVALTAGTRVMLDLYGTNHDARHWPEPEQFRPERFLGWDGDPFTLIPQGGGDLATGHRCAGEQLTIELMKTTLRFLTRTIAYDVPEQDLSISLRTIPTLPASRFVMTNVRAR